MKKNLFSGSIKPIFIASLLIALSFSLSMAETYKLDSAHTSVVFRVKHLGVSYAFGNFFGSTGSFTYDEGLPEKHSIQMQVNADNIHTGVKKRDDHLRSPDSFNAKDFPVISFKSTTIKKIGNDLLEVTGNLTLLEKTRTITVEVRHTGSGKDPWGGFRRGFETTFTIKRSDYGMDFMLAGVSDEVTLTVSVEGIRQ